MNFSFSNLIIVSFGIMFFSSCHKSDKYEKYIKELDSLKIVIEQSIVNFNSIDSATCYNAYSKQYTYANFINVNLKDTVPKATAEALQTFYLLGRNMENYLAMRPVWILESHKSITQLTNLSHDLKNGSVTDKEAVDFINEEKKEAEKIIIELNKNTDSIRFQLEQFNLNIATVEIVVKKLNHEILPEIVTPVIKAHKEKD